MIFVDRFVELYSFLNNLHENSLILIQVDPKFHENYSFLAFPNFPLLRVFELHSTFTW